MPCSGTATITYPVARPDPYPVTCPMGGVAFLPMASGDGEGTCAAQRSRARINGGAWQYGGASSYMIAYSPPRHRISWSVNGVPGVLCGQNNQLEAEVELSDSTWIAAAPVNFSAYCSPTGSPPRAMPAGTMYAACETLEPVSALWGAVTGKLATKQSVALQLVEPPEGGPPPDFIEWRSTGAAAGLWRLIMNGRREAELRLRLPVEYGGESAYIEQVWGSGDFSSRNGGRFGPLRNIVIPHVLVVSDVQPIPMMALRTRPTKATSKRKTKRVKKSKRRTKAKAPHRSKAKKRRARR